MTEPKPPTLLVDTDCVLSLDPWEEDAKGRRWFALFSRIAPITSVGLRWPPPTASGSATRAGGPC